MVLVLLFPDAYVGAPPEMVEHGHEIALCVIT